MDALFHRFAAHFNRLMGSTYAFFVVLAGIIIIGFYLGFTERWTAESIVVLASFLILFFLQHSQNINDKATHLKLDELIRAMEGARNEVMAVEDKAEEEIDELKEVIVEAINDDAKVEVAVEANTDNTKVEVEIDKGKKNSTNS